MKTFEENRRDYINILNSLYKDDHMLQVRKIINPNYMKDLHTNGTYNTQNPVARSQYTVSGIHSFLELVDFSKIERILKNPNEVPNYYFLNSFLSAGWSTELINLKKRVESSEILDIPNNQNLIFIKQGYADFGTEVYLGDKTQKIIVIDKDDLENIKKGDYNLKVSSTEVINRLKTMILSLNDRSKPILEEHKNLKIFMPSHIKFNRSKFKDNTQHLNWKKVNKIENADIIITDDSEFDQLSYQHKSIKILKDDVIIVNANLYDQSCFKSIKNDKYGDTEYYIKGEIRKPSFGELLEEAESIQFKIDFSNQLILDFSKTQSIDFFIEFLEYISFINVEEIKKEYALNIHGFFQLNFSSVSEKIKFFRLYKLFIENIKGYEYNKDYHPFINDILVTQSENDEVLSFNNQSYIDLFKDFVLLPSKCLKTSLWTRNIPEDIPLDIIFNNKCVPKTVFNKYLSGDYRIDFKMYNTIRTYLEHSDPTYHELAISMITESDLKPSIYYVWLLFAEFGLIIDNSKSSKLINFKTFLNLYYETIKNISPDIVYPRLIDGLHVKDTSSSQKQVGFILALNPTIINKYLLENPDVLEEMQYSYRFFIMHYLFSSDNGLYGHQTNFYRYGHENYSANIKYFKKNLISYNLDNGIKFKISNKNKINGTQFGFEKLKSYKITGNMLDSFDLEIFNKDIYTTENTEFLKLLPTSWDFEIDVIKE